MEILYTLLLLLVANGAPVITRRLIGRSLEYPVDGGLRLGDGNPLFGTSKTWLGIAVSIIATALTASLIGLTLAMGTLVGLLAMLGDLSSSFIKRRIGLKSSSQAFGLDQLLESLFPLVVLQSIYKFSLIELILIITLFVALELILSRILYKFKIRQQPY